MYSYLTYQCVGAVEGGGRRNSGAEEKQWLTVASRAFQRTLRRHFELVFLHSITTFTNTHTVTHFNTCFSILHCYSFLCSVVLFDFAGERGNSPLNRIAAAGHTVLLTQLVSSFLLSGSWPGEFSVCAWQCGSSGREESSRSHSVPLLSSLQSLHASTPRRSTPHATCDSCSLLCCHDCYVGRAIVFRRPSSPLPLPPLLVAMRCMLFVALLLTLLAVASARCSDYKSCSSCTNQYTCQW